MAPPTKKVFAAGLNAARVYALDSSGYGAASSTSVYDGLAIGGPITFDYQFPDPSMVVFPGNDQKLQQIKFAPVDPSTATLTVSRMDFTTIAALSNTLSVAHATNINVIGMGTNQQGAEPTVAFVVYQTGADNAGNVVYTTYVFPKIQFTPKTPPMTSRERSDIVYNGNPQVGTQYFDGVDYVSGTDGYGTAEVNIYQSSKRLHWAWFKGDNSATAFSFDTDLPADAGLTARVTVNGVLKTLTTDYTITTAAVTFEAAAKPGSGAMVCVVYELGSTAVDIE